MWRVSRLRSSVLWVEVRGSAATARPGVVVEDVSRSLCSYMANWMGDGVMARVEQSNGRWTSASLEGDEGTG